MSTDQIAELSERLSVVREAVARVETRQTVVLDLLERSQASLGEYHGRLTNMEREAHTIKTKLWLVALVSGAVFSTIWELIKRRLSF
jgi:chromosome segregation ATPase